MVLQGVSIVKFIIANIVHLRRVYRYIPSQKSDSESILPDETQKSKKTINYSEDAENIDRNSALMRVNRL